MCFRSTRRSAPVKTLRCLCGESEIYGMDHIRKIFAFTLLCNIVIELTDFSVANGSCSLTWTQAGDFCYKRVDSNTTVNDTEKALTLCAQEKGVFPVLRSAANFEAFRNLLTQINRTNPIMRVPIGLQKSRNITFHWADSGNNTEINAAYWGEGQPQYFDTEKCVALQAENKLHDYDCDVPTNAVCQRGLLDDSRTEIPCFELRRCISSDDVHRTETNSFECTLAKRQLDAGVRLGFVANVYYENLTQALYAFRLPQPSKGKNANQDAETLILAVDSQTSFLIEKGYRLVKTVGFLPNVSSAQGIEPRYIYWKNTPPSDSVLVKAEERTKFEQNADEQWNLTGSVYVFANQFTENMCALDIDCQWTQWQSWSECSQSCDGGQRIRRRSISRRSSGAGTCSGNDTEIDSTPCSQICARDCQWNSWQAWSPCSQTCDGGYRTRKRSILHEATGEGTCYGNETEIDNGPCSEECSVDCEWNTWNAWSSCSVTCADGIQTRDRSVKSKARGKGKICQDAFSKEIMNCTAAPCPIDCVMNDWSPFSPCAATCGPSGLQFRNRRINITDQYKGVPCPPQSAWTDVSMCPSLPTCPPQNDTYVDPLPLTWRVAVQAMQSLGSSAVIACSAGSFVLSIAFRAFSPEGILHIGQETTLIAAHTLITIFGYRGQTNGINADLCVPASIALHYLFIVYFVFMALEAIQVYSVLTNVISGDGFFSRKTNYVLALTSPLAIVLPTAMLCHSSFESKNSCWVNAGNATISFFIVGPLIISCAAILILVEAAGVEDYYPPLPFFDHKREQVANICRAGLVIKAPLALISYIFGTLAVFHQEKILYTFAMPLNICVGVCTLMFHISANETVLAFVRQKILTRFSWCRRRFRVDPEDVFQRSRPSSGHVLAEIKRLRYEKAVERRQEQKRHLLNQRVGAKFFMAEHNSVVSP